MASRGKVLFSNALATSGGSITVNSIAGQLSGGYYELPDGVSTAIVSASGVAGTASIAVFDSDDAGGPYQQGLDPDALQAGLTGSKRWLVGSLGPFLKVWLGGSGNWTIRVTPVYGSKAAQPTAALVTAPTGGGFAPAQGVGGSTTTTAWLVALAAQSVTISTIEQKVRAGQAFVWSPGRIAAAASEHARLLISNPGGSGKTVFVYARFLTLDVAAVCVVSLYRNPSVGAPTLGAVGAGIANQLLGSATTSVAQVGADHSATAMAAGTGAALTTEAGVGIGRQAYPAPLYEIPQSQALGIDVLVSAAATGVIPEVTWWEE